MKIWNKSICLNSRKTVLLIVVVLLSTLVLAGVWPTKDLEIKTITQSLDVKESEMWVPTEEDIAYQDSMYQIIRSTQSDINDIKKDIVHILERLDYEDGSWDSIRYVKGGKIDKRRN